MFELLVLLIIASLAGSVGASLAGRKGLGCLPSLALGFVGALLGRWLAQQLDLPLLWTIRDFPVIWSVIGAALFVAVLGLISGRGRS
ncbi:MAG: GlsB/YeaQ/YmgE family stress response membrane protein [Acidimicrobiia bacterium]|nr:GlsB/YeaQ/YmgE family stress response membrane protein [Acidimicrobiia bacterium]